MTAKMKNVNEEKFYFWSCNKITSSFFHSSIQISNTVVFTTFYYHTS